MSSTSTAITPEKVVSNAVDFIVNMDSQKRSMELSNQEVEQIERTGELLRKIMADIEKNADSEDESAK